MSESRSTIVGSQFVADMPITRRLKNALLRRGFLTRENLESLRVEEVSKFNGIGTHAVTEYANLIDSIQPGQKQESDVDWVEKLPDEVGRISIFATYLSRMQKVGLHKHEARTVSDLCRLKDSDIKRILNTGKKGVNDIRRFTLRIRDAQLLGLDFDFITKPLDKRKDVISNVPIDEAWTLLESLCEFLSDPVARKIVFARLSGVSRDKSEHYGRSTRQLKAIKKLLGSRALAIIDELYKNRVTPLRLLDLPNCHFWFADFAHDLTDKDIADPYKMLSRLIIILTGKKYTVIRIRNEHLVLPVNKDT